MAFELGKLNENLASRQTTLEKALAGDDPHVETKSGKEHHFDEDILKQLEQKLPKEIWGLKLPMLFYTPSNVPGSCYLTDEKAGEALKLLGHLGKDYEFRDGKLWISRALVLNMTSQLPTLTQFVMM